MHQAIGEYDFPQLHVLMENSLPMAGGGTSWYLNSLPTQTLWFSDSYRVKANLYFQGVHWFFFFQNQCFTSCIIIQLPSPNITQPFRGLWLNLSCWSSKHLIVMDCLSHWFALGNVYKNYNSPSSSYYIKSD